MINKCVGLRLIGRSNAMLAELSITLLGRGTHLSGDLGRILKIIDESGIR